MKTDSLFYRLFQSLPGLALELAGIETGAGGGYRFRSEEIKQTAFRVDGVLVPPAEWPESPLVFVEVQYQPDEEFYGRFFAEILLYLYRCRPPHPWRAVVIYPNRAVERVEQRHYGSLLNLPEVRRVYLADFAGKPATTLGVRLIQLLIGDTEQAVAQARQLLNQARAEPRFELSFEQILELVETILVYRLPQWGREEIKAMLGLDTELKQTRFYQEVFTEGRQEGRQEESVNLVLRQLRRRFGPLAPKLEERIHRLPLAQAEALAEVLLDFREVADLERWLAR